MAVIQPPSITKFSGAIINGLGDSIIGSQSQYFPYGSTIVAPAWAASTAYIVGQCILNGGNLYRCSVAGTSAGSGGPTGFGTSIADNTVTWVYYNYQTSKGGTAFLSWAEKYSLGRLNFDLSQGYAGPFLSVIKVIVVNGGSNYVGGDTVTFNQGASGTLVISNGVITGVNLTNCGYGTSAFTVAINTSTGSGAVLSLVTGGSGTFGVSGAGTADMVARLQDCVASKVDIFAVHGGTNDISGGSVSYATITGNLKICYETLVAAGKKVIAVPILPRTGLTNAKMALLMRVNRWIRAYCNKEAWANPSGTVNVVLADSVGHFSDGGSLTNQPIGGAGGVAGAMTQDGVHPSVRGAAYVGYAVWLAAQQFLGAQPVYGPRSYTIFDGVDPTQNPGGNYLEGYAWQQAGAYTIGMLSSANGNVYRCTQNGASAGTGAGPSGTGTNIVDNLTRWNYVSPQGMSVLTGTSGTSVAAGGITFSGTFPSGYKIQRNTGSASGTITGSTESPWSNGQTGQRAVLQFSLGSGGTNEVWWLTAFFNAYGVQGIVASDLGVSSFYAEAELELSSVANLTQLNIALIDNSATWNNYDGSIATGAGARYLQSSSEMIALPNNGKIYLRTQPSILPPTLVNFCFNLVFAFDASGGAGSATATAKVNYMGVRKAGVG